MIIQNKMDLHDIMKVLNLDHHQKLTLATSLVADVALEIQNEKYSPKLSKIADEIEILNIFI